MNRALRTRIAVSGIVLSSLSGAAYAQGTFTNITANAEYRIPAISEESKSYPTVAEWAADGYQAGVSAESRSNNDDSPENVAKASAFFSQSGVGVAKGYGFSGANYSKYPVDVHTRTAITSQYNLRVEGEFDPLSPYVLKGYLPVHGTFGAFDFTHEVGSAVASAFTGMRVETDYYYANGQPAHYDVTHGGTVTIRSKDYNYNPDDFAFEVEATDDLKNAVTLRHDLPDPEEFNWTTNGAELSQLIVFDLPLVYDFLGGVQQDFSLTFTQEITTSLRRAGYKFAYADLRNTTGFEIVAVDPNTGERLDGVISVQLVGAGGPTAAPEPASLAFVLTFAVIISLPVAARRIVRRMSPITVK